MTEAGQLDMGDAIWRDGKVWWVATIGSTGEVTFVDEPHPQDRQVTVLDLERHEEVTRAGEALMDARGRHEEAVNRMRRARQSLTFEIAQQQAHRAEDDMAVMDAAGIVAGFALGSDR